MSPAREMCAPVRSTSPPIRAVTSEAPPETTARRHVALNQNRVRFQSQAIRPVQIGPDQVEIGTDPRAGQGKAAPHLRPAQQDASTHRAALGGKRAVVGIVQGRAVEDEIATDATSPQRNRPANGGGAEQQVAPGLEPVRLEAGQVGPVESERVDDG
jgi:hypothetical protein